MQRPAEAPRRAALGRPGFLSSLGDERFRFMIQLMLPSFLMLVLFQGLPVIMGIVTSFQRFNMYETTVRWNGFDNYLAVFRDKHFLTVIVPNTLIFMVAAVAVEFCLGMGIAMLINRKFRLAGVVRTILILPLMVAPLISGLMFAWMFNDQFGVVNVILGVFGIKPIAWLTMRWTAFFAILMADVWSWTPWFIIILFAGLQTLPKDPHEAAMLDGANAWQIFWHVTLPLMFPVVAVTLVLRSFDAFRVFDIVWAVTGGGPGRGTETFSVYTYKEAFGFMKFGTSAAVANLGALLQMVIGLLFYRTVHHALQHRRDATPL